MYAYINAERWAEDGHPDLTEQHSSLFGTGEYWGCCYGFLIVDAEQEYAITLARGRIFNSREQLVLPFD